MPPTRTLLVIDGNSLIHRAYHAGASEGHLDRDGRPIWALRGLVGYIARAAAHLRPEALLVGFDCPEDSARRVEYPGYKAHRPDKPADLSAQIAVAPAMLRAAGIRVVVPPAYEADDVLASSAEHARRNGWRSVLMTSDRDAFALIDETTSVLRVRNGGFDEAVLVDAEALPVLYGVHPWQYRDFAALRGDPSDNLPGVRRYGETTATKLLSSFGTIEAAWDSGPAGVREVVGDLAAGTLCEPEMRAVVELNRRIMRMRTDLPLPELHEAGLPLNLMVMRQALREHGVILGPSLWALTGGAPPDNPAGDLTPELGRWVFRRGLSGKRDPIPGQLSLF